jgi:5-methylcytosine-specific restriction protein A
MPRALRVCPCLGCTAHDGSCPELTPGGKCQPCRTAGDLARGTSRERGYNTLGHRAFRSAVLRKNPICVCDYPNAHGHGASCLRQSTRADHHPTDRRELVRLGLDANDARYGRGLCGGCDSSQTAVRQPGGWAVG